MSTVWDDKSPEVSSNPFGSKNANSIPKVKVKSNIVGVAHEEECVDDNFHLCDVEELREKTEILLKK